ncbi:hypothetical protein PMAYCL1PPCAC_24077, partial [Pristionchus mayeri]
SAMGPLLFLLIAASSVLSTATSIDQWEGLIIRASSTDCSACQLAVAGFSQQIPDSVYSALSTKCSLLPSQLGSICHTSLTKIIEYVKEGLQSRIPDCAIPCSNPSLISSTHLCSLIEPAFSSLDTLFADLSSTLIPTICQSEGDQHDCTRKIGSLLAILKTPVTNVFKRIGHLLDCEQFKSLGDGGKLGADWTTHHILCTGCQATLKGIALIIGDGEETAHLVESLHKTLKSACESILEDEPTLMKEAPPCAEAASTIVRRLREDEAANDKLCQISYDCPPMRTKAKDEL